jgi:hypothetical protein
MDAPRWLSTYLWVAPATLQAVLVVLMIRRKLALKYPAFFAYTVCEVAQFLVLFPMDHMDSVSGPQYAQAWLVANGISVILRFAVVHEIFSDLLDGYAALQQFGTILFRCATAFLMIVAVILVASTSGTEMNKLNVAFQVVDRAVSIVQCGLLVFLIFLVRFFRVSWNPCSFGVALGMGLFASVELGVSALRAQYGLYVAYKTLPIVTMVTYHCCVIVWLVSALASERKTTDLTAPPIQELEHWNDAVARLLQQ